MPTSYSDTSKMISNKGNLSVNNDKSLLRGSWFLGRVIETFPDANNLIRSACVRSKHSVVLKPISKLRLIVAEEN